MNEYNGWKNETTWTVNILLMETIEELVKNGYTLNDVASHFYKTWKIDDLNWHVNQIFGCAWKQIDWWTLYKRAEENVKQTAESVAE